MDVGHGPAHRAPAAPGGRRDRVHHRRGREGDGDGFGDRDRDGFGDGFGDRDRDGFGDGFGDRDRDGLDRDGYYGYGDRDGDGHRRGDRGGVGGHPGGPGGGGDPRAARRRRWRAARSVVVWAAVAGVAGWLGVRVAGVGRGTVIETFVVFTPYVAVGSVVVALAAFALRARRAALAATGCCVGYALVLTPLFLTGPSPVPPPRGPELRVMSVNVQFGWADAGAVVDLVRDGDVDVLGVQELTPAFADRLATAGIDDLLPHSVVDARGGAAGSGLYSRHPVEQVPVPVAGGFANPTGRVDVPGARPVEVTVVHAAPPVTSAARDEWGHTLRSLPRPEPRGTVRLLIGDFNATVDQPTMRDVLGEGYVDAAGAVGRGWATTWRFRLAPPLAIDHVLVDRATAVDRVSVRDVAGSDHRAVVADLRLPAD